MNNKIKSVLCAVFVMIFIICTVTVAFATEQENLYPESIAIWSLYDHTIHPACQIEYKSKTHYFVTDGYKFSVPDGEALLMDYSEKDRCTTKAEGVAVRALYVFICPECGKYNNGYTFSSLVCNNCKHDCKEEKVYRFIVVPEDSVYYKSFSSVNMVTKTKSYFKETACNYGDGVDLPQSSLKYENDVLIGFEKSSFSVINWRAFLQYILYPLSVFIEWGANQNWGSVRFS